MMSLFMHLFTTIFGIYWNPTKKELDSYNMLQLLASTVAWSR